VHSVANIVRDLRLQFTDETLKDRHVSAREKPSLLKGADMLRDQVKVLVDSGKGLIRLKLSSKISSSHFLSYSEGFWSGLASCYSTALARLHLSAVSLWKTKMTHYLPVPEHEKA
jgi:hypothetical protein